jgi:predicted translin family RNA/ssDNA-binding protein
MKIIRLTESDLTSIVKRVVNENFNPLDRLRDDLNSISRKLLRSMDDYTTLNRKGDYKRMGDELDNLRKMVRKIKDVIQEIENKI